MIFIKQKHFYKPFNNLLFNNLPLKIFLNIFDISNDYTYIKHI